jgi:hypothetical protein
MTTPTLRDSETASLSNEALAIRVERIAYILENGGTIDTTRVLQALYDCRLALTAPEQSPADGGQAIPAAWGTPLVMIPGTEWRAFDAITGKPLHFSDLLARTPEVVAPEATPAAPTSGEPATQADEAPKIGHMKHAEREALGEEGVAALESMLTPPSAFGLSAGDFPAPPSAAQAEGAKWVVHQIAGDLKGTTVHGEFDTEEEADAAASVLGDYWAGTDRPALTAAPEKLAGFHVVADASVPEGQAIFKQDGKEVGRIVGLAGPATHQQAGPAASDSFARQAKELVEQHVTLDVKTGVSTFKTGWLQLTSAVAKALREVAAPEKLEGHAVWRAITAVEDVRRHLPEGHPTIARSLGELRALLEPSKPRRGAVWVDGALQCCIEYDREPCPHDPARRCASCPGGSTAAPAPHQQAAQPEKLAPAPQQAGQAAAWMEMPVPARGDVVVFAIDTARINHLMLDGMMDCLAAAKRARWTNVVTRKDGVERTWEADWLKHLTRLSPDAVRALATTAAATPPSPQQAAQGGERETSLPRSIWLNDMGTEQKLSFKPISGAHEHHEYTARAAQGGREGLTEEQIAQLWAFEWVGDRVQLVRAIERAHGIGITPPAGDSAASQGGSGGGA